MTAKHIKLDSFTLYQSPSETHTHAWFHLTKLALGESVRVVGSVIDRDDAAPFASLSVLRLKNGVRSSVTESTLVMDSPDTMRAIARELAALADELEQQQG